jgi:hypothetical protein
MLSLCVVGFLISGCLHQKVKNKAFIFPPLETILQISLQDTTRFPFSDFVHADASATLDCHIFGNTNVASIYWFAKLDKRTCILKDGVSVLPEKVYSMRGVAEIKVEVLLAILKQFVVVDNNQEGLRYPRMTVTYRSNGDMKCFDNALDSSIPLYLIWQEIKNKGTVKLEEVFDNDVKRVE